MNRLRKMWRGFRAWLWWQERRLRREEWGPSPIDGAYPHWSTKQKLQEIDAEAARRLRPQRMED